MVKVLVEKEVPKAEINCTNCGSLLEYGNADLSEHFNYQASYLYYTKYYIVCPVCGCAVNVSWIMNKVE